MMLRFQKNKVAMLVGMVFATSIPGYSIAAEADETDDSGAPVVLDTLRVQGEKPMSAATAKATENTGSYTTNTMNTSTKLDLSIRETPQSVSVVTRTQMDDFGLTSINDVLHNTTGINVVEVESDRTTYNARGFLIDNFLVDGLGLPLTGNLLHGEIDTAIYDRIEVLRGTSALLTGIGNPSATINQIRKRPTADFQASTQVSIGTWNFDRLDGDISGALNDSGNIRGRLVAAQESADSYIDRYTHDTNLLYGVLEADLSTDTVLSIGYSTQDNKVDGSISGGIPLFYTDGSETDYDVSVSSAADWAFWDTTDERAFVELAHDFTNGWRGTAVYNRIENTSDAEQMFLYWRTFDDPTTPLIDESSAGVDPNTGLGAVVYTGSYEYEKTQNVIDVYASGPFSLAGREHELVAGVSFAKSELEEQSRYDPDESYANPFPYDLETWNGAYPKGLFTEDGGGSDVTDKQKSVYAAAHFNPADSLKVITGARLSKWETDGDSYGTNVTTSHDKVITPYFGVIYDINPSLSTYGSYAKTFLPQTEKDFDGDRLDPKDGVNYEIGMKGSFYEDRLNATLALFRTLQNNVADFVGTRTDVVTPYDYYRGVDGVTGKGFEFDIAGEVLESLQVNFGFTRLVMLENADGDEVNLFIPRTSLRTSAVYRLPALQQLKVGAALNWQSEVSRNEGVNDSSGDPIISKQEAFTLVNLMARYDFSEHISATFNVNNVTDEKYLTTMQYEQSHYGSPRHYLVSLRWDY